VGNGEGRVERTTQGEVMVVKGQGELVHSLFSSTIIVSTSMHFTVCPQESNDPPACTAASFFFSYSLLSHYEMKTLGAGRCYTDGQAEADGGFSRHRQ